MAPSKGRNTAPDAPILEGHNEPQGLPGVVGGLQVSVGSLVSIFAHLPSSSGEHSCRGPPGLQPGGEPAAQRPGPRCGPLGWRHCKTEGPQQLSPDHRGTLYTLAFFVYVPAMSPVFPKEIRGHREPQHLGGPSGRDSSPLTPGNTLSWV